MFPFDDVIILVQNMAVVGVGLPKWTSETSVTLVLTICRPIIIIQGYFLLVWIIYLSQHGWVIICRMKCGIRLLIYSKPQRHSCWSWGMDKLFHPTFYIECNYLFLLRLKLCHLSKRGPPLHTMTVNLHSLTNHIIWQIIYSTTVHFNYIIPHAHIAIVYNCKKGFQWKFS